MSTSKHFYENKLRVRVCGLCFKGNKILLVKHNLNGDAFYAPPGGAVEFGETMEEALKREMLEETSIEANSVEFKFITEYLNPPLHAIEMFYYVNLWDGKPMVGNDPETEEIDIIQDVSFHSVDDLKKIKTEELHQVLHNCNNLRELLDLSGYIPPSKKYKN